MKVKITTYEWFLNIFTLSVLGGLAYLIWSLAAGLEWYWKFAWVVGLFSAGGLLCLACANGFGAQAVFIINHQDGRKNHE